ncbi:MAG: uroporphyrinogen decarboxylase family protein [Pseudomonadota bacterium]
MIGEIVRDTMSPGQRMQCLIRGESIDRVPFNPFANGFVARMSGMDRGDFYRHPEKAFGAGLEFMKTFSWMNTRPTYGWADRGIWEFGGEIVWPDRERYAAPMGAHPLIDRPDDVDRLPDPDPARAGMNPLVARFNQLSREKGFPASLPGASPTASSSAIAGRENFLRWMIKYPDAVHKLQSKVTDFIINTSRRTIEDYGGENCSAMVSVPLESNQIMSEKMFVRFCKPYLNQVIEFYVSSGVRSFMVHLCGDHRQNLPHWQDFPLPPRTVYSIGHEMDLEWTGAQIGPQNILAGNIHTSLLQTGTPDQVRDETARCLQAGMKHPGGFILMPACEFPPDTPLENLEALALTLCEQGYY